MIRRLSKVAIFCIAFLFSFSNSFTQSDSAKTMTWQEMRDSTLQNFNSKSYANALKWGKQSLQILEREFGDMDDEYINILNLLGVIYFYMEDYDSARKYGEICLQKDLIKCDTCYPDLFNDYQNLSHLSYITGDYKRAEIYYNEALRIKRILEKTENVGLADYILTVANFKKAYKKNEEADNLFKEALGIYKRIFSGDNFYISYCLNYYGSFLTDLNRYDEAESMLTEALEMNRRLSPNNEIKWVGILNNLANLYAKSDDFQKAEKYYLEAIEIWNKSKKDNDLNIGICFNNLAYLYKNQNKYTDAETSFLKALKILKKQNKNSTELKNVMDGLVNFYYYLGQYDNAEKYSKEVIGLSKIENMEAAKRKNMLAKIYIDQGRLVDAEPLFKEALEINKRVYKTDHSEISSSLNNLAYLYYYQGRYSDAERIWLESLEMDRRIYKGDNLSISFVLNNLGNLYKDQKRYLESEIVFKESLEISQRICHSDHEVIAASLNGLGCLYFEMDKLKESETNYIAGLEMFKRLNKGDYRGVATTMNNIADLYASQDRFVEAEEYLKKALEIRQRLFKGSNPDIAVNLLDLAIISYYLNKKDEVESLLLESVEAQKNIYSSNSISLSEKEKEQYWDKMSKYFDYYYSLFIKIIRNKPGMTGNLYDNLLFTKGLLFNSANKIKKRILESNDSILISKFKDLVSQKEILLKFYSLPVDTIKKWGYNIDSLENITNDLEKELSLKSEDFKQSYEKKKVNWKLIQAFLKPDEVAIEMVRFRLNDKHRFSDTIYYAALIVSDQTTENPDIVFLDNGKELEEIFYNQYRNFVKMKASDNESFKQFWQKIFEKTKDYKKIYFSPDGIYNKLNISTLQVEPGKYLLDYQEIHQLNSTQDILLGYYSKQKETNVYNSAVLIGNPDFSLSQDKVKEKERTILSQKEILERSSTSARTMTIPPLPGSEKEVDNISKYLKRKKWDVFKYTRGDAVKAVIKTANSPRVLHIATHGLFLSDIKLGDKDVFGIESKRIIGNPLLRSGLFFAGASSTLDEDFRPSGYDNGFLTAYEAMNLNLDKTELVVLSACETGLGEIKNGEGVYRLQRAFIQAGAKSIIMSLWSVSDEATQELMSTFYKEWLGGKTKREAFHFAQMKLKEKYTYPYFWGAFVMVGE
jgi:CHAT domain-containing protein/Tfp pilus assembly protein PilF